MKKYTSNILVLSVAILSLLCMSCSNDDGGDAPSANPEMVSFGIDVEKADGSRASIFNDTDLENSCTPTSGKVIDGNEDLSERVGIVADLKFKDDAQRTEVRYINHYMYKTPEGWKYYVRGSDATTDQRKRWVRNTKMVCTAYYPAKYLVESDKLVDATITAENLTVGYSAATEQVDLLAGFNIVDSDNRTDKDGNKLVNDNLVKLDMKHALAALKFQFKSPNTLSDDKLTKVWIDDENSGTEGDDYFGVVGKMTYIISKTTVNGKETHEAEFKWTRERAQKWQNYVWQNAEGVPLTFNDDASQAVMAVPYDNNNDDTNTEGEIYDKNNGYILIIPQQISQFAYLCFTTKNGGSKNVIKQPLLIKGGITEWKPNNRYNYTITLSPAGIQWSVDVQPWNEIKSNTGIDFD